MWYKINNQQVHLQIIVKPNAKQTACVTISDQGLHIALHAKPHDGEANQELIRYLSKLFQIPKSRISLLRGEKSRHKTILIPFTEDVNKLLLSLKPLQNDMHIKQIL